MNRLDIRGYQAMFGGLHGRIACLLQTSADHAGNVWYAKDENEARLTLELAIDSATAEGSAVKVSAISRADKNPHLEVTRAIPIAIPVTKLAPGGCAPHDCPDGEALEDLRLTGTVIAREQALLFGLPPSMTISAGWQIVLIYLLTKDVCPRTVRGIGSGMGRLLGGKALLDEEDFFPAPGSWDRDVPRAPRPVHVTRSFPYSYAPEELARRVEELGEATELGGHPPVPIVEEHRLLGQLGPTWPPPLSPELDRILARDFIAAALFEGRPERDEALRAPASDLALARRLVRQGLRDESALLTLVANRPGRGRREPRGVVRAVLAALAAVPDELPADAVHLAEVPS